MGFDAGTQSVKVAVCDENFNLIASRSLATTLRYPHPGWVEMDVENYLENCLECMRLVAEDLRAAGRDPKDVAAVMGDGVICGIVGIDENARPVTPYINYLDSRTQADVDAINAKLGRKSIYFGIQASEIKHYIRRRLKSSSYTTSWDGLAVVR